MALSGPSQTAIRCARARACHMIVDPKPWIYEDHIAGRFVDIDGQIAEGYDLEEIKKPHITQTRAVMVIRERFGEDALAEAVKGGATQYVVLGAGLNGFAYNGSKLSKQVRVFEVDHPATQSWKRERLEEIGATTPENVRFVPVDFDSDILSECLIANGFDTSSPAVFTWTGVTQYIDDEAINSTLGEILRISAAGSALSIQIILPKHAVGQKDQDAIDFFMRMSADLGEPWINAQDPEEFPERLRRMGFDDVEMMTSADAVARYTLGRTDNLRMGGYCAMVKALIN